MFYKKEKSNLKLQSAMEYLGTYGWSILIIAITLVSLFELGLFNGKGGFVSQSCISESGYLCSNPILYTSGVLIANVGAIGQSITITGTGCSLNNSNPSITPIISDSLSSGEVVSLQFQCPLSSNSIGTTLSGYLWIQYSNQNQNNLTSLIGKVSVSISETAPSPEELLYTANSNNTVSVYNLASDVIEHTITGAGLNQPRDIIFSSDGTKAFVLNAGDNQVLEFNTATNSIIKTFQMSNYGITNLAGIALSPSGNILYAANYGPNGSGNSIYEINISSENVANTINGIQWTGSMVLSPNGQYLYSTGCNNQNVDIINIATGLVVNTIYGSLNCAEGMAISNNGNYLYILTRKPNITIASTVSNSIVGNIIGTGFNAPTGLALNESNGNIYIPDQNADKVWVANVISNTITNYITFPNYGGSGGIGYLPNTNYMYLPNANLNLINILNMATNTIISNTIILAEINGPFSIATSPKSPYLYMTNQNGDTVSIINPATNSTDSSISGFKIPWGIAISPNGKTAYVGNAGNNTISIVNLVTDQITGTITNAYWPAGLAVSGNGQYLYATNFYNGQVNVYNLQTSSVIDTISGFGRDVAVAISPSNPDSLYVTSECCNVANITITSISQAKTENTIAGSVGGDGDQGVAFLPNGQYAYAVGNGAYVINTATNTITGSISGLQSSTGVAVYSLYTYK